jgi:hypothetical protein
VAHTVEESPKSDLGKEVPKLVSADWFLSFIFETARQSNDFLKLNNAGMRKIQLG